MKGEIGLLEIPEKSDWHCHIAGMIYMPDKNDEPNWFHRKMQELCFGAKWVKKPKSKTLLENTNKGA